MGSVNLEPSRSARVRSIRLPVKGVAWCGQAEFDLPTVASLVVPDIGAGAFAVEIRGDSLAPEVANGDFAIARPGNPGAGDLVVIERTNGSMLLKRWGKSDGATIEIVGNDGTQALPTHEVASVAVVHVVVKRVHRRKA